MLDQVSNVVCKKTYASCCLHTHNADFDTLLAADPVAISVVIIRSLQALKEPLVCQVTRHGLLQLFETQVQSEEVKQSMICNIVDSIPDQQLGELLSQLGMH